MSDSDYDEEEEATDLSNETVVEKYEQAGRICTDALEYVMAFCEPGASVVSVCEAGDVFIVQETEKLYPPKKEDKIKKKRKIMKSKQESLFQRVFPLITLLDMSPL